MIDEPHPREDQLHPMFKTNPAFLAEFREHARAADQRCAVASRIASELPELRELFPADSGRPDAVWWTEDGKSGLAIDEGDKVRLITESGNVQADFALPAVEALALIKKSSGDWFAAMYEWESRSQNCLLTRAR
jgi:hypothetical protein